MKIDINEFINEIDNDPQREQEEGAYRMDTP